SGPPGVIARPGPAKSSQKSCRPERPPSSASSAGRAERGDGRPVLGSKEVGDAPHAELTIAAPPPGARRAPRRKPAAGETQSQGADFSRKKRAAFSHISFCVALSPSVLRQAITASA